MAIDKSKFKIEKNEGVATLTYEDEQAFYDGCDIDKKTIKAVFDHSNSYIAEVTKVVSTEATTIMDKDKSINTVIANTPYGVSKRGSVDILAKRSHTYPGMKGGDATTKSTLKVVVKDPLTKISKTTVRELESVMTKALLG